MSTHYATPSRIPALTAAKSLTCLRVLSLLSVLNILFQGATAGRILMGNGGALGLHEAGAIALHILTGLTMIAAGQHWRSSRGAIWPTIIAAIVFIASFVQAAFGTQQTLYVHVPLAFVLLLGATLTLAWSWFGITITTSR
ncbi:MAG: hypothetical protein ACRDSH_12135, partial [Pseudonocardiaceae bacterium]